MGDRWETLITIIIHMQIQTTSSTIHIIYIIYINNQNLT